MRWQFIPMGLVWCLLPAMSHAENWEFACSGQVTNSDNPQAVVNLNVRATEAATTIIGDLRFAGTYRASRFREHLLGFRNSATHGSGTLSLSTSFTNKLSIQQLKPGARDRSRITFMGECEPEPFPVAFSLPANQASCDAPPGPNVNWGGCDKTSADLSEKDLSGAILIGSILNDQDLRSTVLNNADLTGANLRRTKLGQAKLKNAILRNATLEGAHFYYTNLSDADLSGADLSNAAGFYVTLSGAKLADADLTGMTLKLSKLDRTNLNNAILQEVNLEGTDLTRASLVAANARHSNLASADLSDAVLTDANFSEAYWVDGTRCAKVSIGGCR